MRERGSRGPLSGPSGETGPEGYVLNVHPSLRVLGALDGLMILETQGAWAPGEGPHIPASGTG